MIIPSSKERPQRSPSSRQRSTTVYDRSKVLFSLKDLKLNEPKTITLKLTIPDYDIVDWQFKIKPCADSFQVSTNDLAKVVNNAVALQDKTLLEALNLFCSREDLLESGEFVTYGTGRHYLVDPFKYGFKPADLPSIPDGKHMMPGIMKKVSVLEGETKKPTVYVTTEIKKTDIHNAQSLAEKIKSYTVMRRQFTSELVNKNRWALKPVLKGLMVYPSYDKKVAFPITGMSDNSAKTKSFSKNGKTISVADYYSKIKRIPLSFPDMSLIVGFVGGKDIAFPIEVLMVAENQRVINSQTTPEEVQVAILASAILPKDRVAQTETMKRAMKLTSLWYQDRRQSGLGQLSCPSGSNCGLWKEFSCIASEQWRADKLAFFVPATVPSWWLISVLSHNDRRCSPDAVSSFGDKVMKSIEPSETAIENIFVQVQSAGIKFLMFVSTDAVKLHEKIKYLDQQFQILTQEVRSSNVAKMTQGLSQTLENIVNKVNSKNGGLGYEVRLAMVPETKKWLDDPSRLFIGFEMTHPQQLSQSELNRGLQYKAPSVLGYASNSGKHHQMYHGDYLYVEPRKQTEMGEAIKTVLPMLVKNVSAARNVKPLHIVFYFHDISEGQYAEVATTFNKRIREGLDQLSVMYKPAISLLAVSKEHNERFYQMNITGDKAPQQNIRAGTVADTVVVNPTINEFYLTAHTAIQGTAKSLSCPTPPALPWTSSRVPVTVSASCTRLSLPPSLCLLLSSSLTVVLSAEQ